MSLTLERETNGIMNVATALFEDEIICIQPQNYDENTREQQLAEYDDRYFFQHGRFDGKAKINSFRKCLSVGENPDDGNRELFSKMMKLLPPIPITKMDFEGKISLLPLEEGNNKAKRSVILISGPSGAGKSFAVVQNVISYKLAYPPNKIFLFSRVQDDETFNEHLPKNIKIHRIPIDDTLIDEMYSIEEFKDCMVIFDDIDALSPEFRVPIQSLLNVMLETGRHQNISIISTNHTLLNSAKTKLINSEANSVYLFLRCASNKPYRQFLQHHAMMSKKAIDKIMALPSRYVVYRTNSIAGPHFVSERAVYLKSYFE